MSESIDSIKRLLKETTGKIVLEDKVKFKIQDVHNVSIENLLNHLKNPEKLIGVEAQQSRNPSDKTFRLAFGESKDKTLVAVVRTRSLENDVFIVTAFSSSKKLEKLIRKHRVMRR